MNSSISKYKPFFEAKFIIPRSKDTDVLKSNVFSLLNLFTKYKLIFIGAPAGFGKTNSLSNWIKSQNLTDNVIWISLDTDDNDPSSFFFHFIKAFDSTIKNNYTANNLKDPYEIEYSLSFILNNLNKINTKIIIILDDYHYISNELIHKGLEKFIINSKENISFIFSGRNKIPNVLSNLRFKFDLLEIDAESFLFTEDEIVGFFDKNNIKITEEQAKYIKNTNEGWILSLKTIILSILNNKKTLIPIEEISNNIKNKYIKGFLFDELLVNLDKSLVDFMMKTSILSYFNVKLCNNLLDISNASFFIEELEKKQLFFYTLDNQSNWYKYHDLFSQILSDKLKTENYSLYVDLCIKSAILFKENSDYDEAVKYAFLSNDYNFISSLLAELAPVFIGDSKILFLYELIEKIPREIIFSNTNLLSYYAFLLAIIYKIDYAKFIINEINKRDDLSENFKILNLLTNVIIYKVDNVNIKKINKSVDLILKNIHLFNKNIVPFVYYYLSRVCHFIYEINKSLILIDEAIINNNKINKNKNIYSFFYTYYNEAKARTLTLKGDLQEAEKLLKNTLAYLKTHNLLEHRTIFGIFGALMIIYSIKYDLKAFDEYKNKLLVLVEKEKVSINKFLAYGAICSAFIQLNKINESKNIIKIIDNLDLDINFKTNNIFYNSHFNDFRILISLSENNFHELPSNWEINIKKEINNILNTQNEVSMYLDLLYEKVTLLVTFYIKKGLFKESLVILKTCYDFINNIIDYPYIKINLLVFEAIIYKKQGNLNKAVERFKKALILAEKNEIINPFIKDEIVIKDLLISICKDYKKRNFDVFNSFAYIILTHFYKAKGLTIRKFDLDDNMNPLSKKEVEILNLINLKLENNEILTKLNISSGTLKVHIKHIYKKLNVSNKKDALNRALYFGFI